MWEWKSRSSYGKILWEDLLAETVLYLGFQQQDQKAGNTQNRCKACTDRGKYHIEKPIKNSL
jgi:hypothetical protein